MCILCTGRQWWRGGAAAMLPWAVIPLVLMWALSGLLLPPRLRIQPTVPRLVCVLILLTALFWYEILVPRLSVWRARHSALLRDRRLSHAIHLHNLRRSATRRCRNCLSPYPLHTPSPARRFMCPNCGHLSKRPILDLPNNPPSAFSPDPLLLSACNLLLCISSFARWARRAVLAVIGSPSENCSSDNDSKGFSSNKGENCSESRSERARRKAEEKRQARLEKEMLEEEERKQREEVARLVEERRKLRDEMLEAEKESLRRYASAGKRENRKGAGKWRQEGRKEKDKGSSKSNSDCEEMEKRVSREREGKHAFDRKNENQKKVSQKMAAPRVPIQSPPRSFKAAVSFVKANNKPANRYGRGQVSMNRNDAQSTVHATGKVTLNGDERKNVANFHRPLESDVQPQLATPKRSWLQLFTRSAAVSPCSDENSTSLLNNRSPVQTQNVHITDQMMSPAYSLDNHINLGQAPSLTGYPPINYPIGSKPVSRSAAEHMPPFFKGSRQGLIPEDTDVFEDPCFVPDPVSLLAPVSESPDNFPLDLGPGFVANNYIEEPRLMKKVSASVDVSRPSPIESPLSRLRVSPRKLSRGMLRSNLEDTSSAHEPGTWQMWGSPMAQNGLGLVGGANWFSHIGLNNSSKEDTTHSLLHDPLLSHVAKENNFLHSRQISPSMGIGNCQNGGICSPLGQLPDGSDLWVQRSLFSTVPADGDNYSFPLSQMDKLLLNEVGCDTPNGSASSENSESSQANCWPKSSCTSHGLEDAGNSPFVSPRIGGLFLTNQDVQPVWSFK